MTKPYSAVPSAGSATQPPSRIPPTEVKVTPWIRTPSRTSSSGPSSGSVATSRAFSYLARQKASKSSGAAGVGMRSRSSSVRP